MLPSSRSNMPDVSATTKRRRLAIGRPRSIAYIKRFLQQQELGGTLCDLTRKLFPYLKSVFVFFLFNHYQLVFFLSLAIFGSELHGIVFTTLRLQDRWGDYDDATQRIRLHLMIRDRQRLVGTLLHELSHAAVYQNNGIVEEHDHGPVFLSWLAKIQQVFPEMSDELLSKPQ